MNELNFIPYQYSVIRYHHDITTDEFLNIGISFYSPTYNYFRTEITTKYKRLTDTFSDADGPEYLRYTKKLMRRFNKLSIEIADNQQLKMLKDLPENVEDLLRLYLRKETSFRYSTPTSGIAHNSIDALDKTFNHLFDTYVNKYIPDKEKKSRNEDEVWKGVYRPEIEKIEENIIHKLDYVEINIPQETLEYNYSWKNGKLNLIEPISFDLVSPGNIANKAHRFFGKNVLLNNSDEVSHLYILLGKPINKIEAVNKKYNNAKDILMSNHVKYNYKRELIEEDGARDFAVFLQGVIKSLK